VFYYDRSLWLSSLWELNVAILYFKDIANCI